MPPKGKKKKKSAKKKGKSAGKAKDGAPSISVQLKRLLECYEEMCLTSKSKVDPQIKPTFKYFMDECKWLVRFVIQGPHSSTSNTTAGGDSLIIDDPLANGGLMVCPVVEPLLRISPLINAIRTMKYAMAKEFYFWDVNIPYEDFATLCSFLEQACYVVNYLEIIDCAVDAYSMERFSRCFQVNTLLTTLVLDYTKLQDDGFKQLSKGLACTRTVIKLSMCYCGLTVDSGDLLGDLISTTSINELYIDGNMLECQGLMDILRLIVNQAEMDTHKRNNPEEIPSLSSVPDIRASASAMSAYGNRATPPPSARKSAKKSGKKKGKKKGKSAKKPPEPPRVGPWLDVLHIGDNGIDSFSDATTFAPVLTMRLLGTWIKHAVTLKELDIDDNLIGDLGGRELLNALEARKELGMDGIFMRVSHRMNGDTFKDICKLASGASKRGKKKKKKGKSGKKRV